MDLTWCDGREGAPDHDGVEVNIVENRNIGMGQNGRVQGAQRHGVEALVEEDILGTGSLRAGASVSVLREEVDAVGVASVLCQLLRGVPVLIRSDDEDCAERHVSTSSTSALLSFLRVSRTKERERDRLRLRTLSFNWTPSRSMCFRSNSTQSA